MTDNDNVIPIRRRDVSGDKFLQMEPEVRGLARAIDTALQVAIIERECGEPISLHGSPVEWLLEQCQQIADGLVKRYGNDGDSPTAA